MKNLTPSIESERLIFRKPAEDDYEFLRQLLRDRDLMKFVSEYITDEQVESIVNRTRAQWEKHGFGAYVTLLRSSMERIGFCGPKYHEVEGRNVIDIGCIVVSKYQNQGIATEGFRRMLSLVFDTLGFDTISSLVNEHNASIQRVLEKMGYRYIRRINRESDGIQYTNECYYELTRDDYEKLG